MDVGEENTMLVVKNINYSYDGKLKVLHNINFKLGKGDFLTIAGPNGSGKTTLIKIITDLLKLKDGEVLVDGLVHDDVIAKRKVIYLSSEDYLPEFLTGYEYIKMICNMYEAELNEKAMNRLATYYSLEYKMNTLIEGYSHGKYLKDSF